MRKKLTYTLTIVLILVMVLVGIVRTCKVEDEAGSALPFDVATTHEKRFHHTRYEGLPKDRAVTEIIRYIKKYLYKRPYAHEHLRHYFQEQTEMVRSHTQDLTPDESSLSVALFGDLMWIGKAHPHYVSEVVVDHLHAHDIVIGNLETPIDVHRRVPNLLPDYLTYNSNPNLLSAFVNPANGRLPFSLLSLANNHALDRGVDGILNTMQLLDEMGVKHTGVFPKDTTGKRYATIVQKNIKIGIYAATFGLNFDKPEYRNSIEINRIPGIAPPDSAQKDMSSLENAISQMRAEGVDFVIVIPHWGYEFELYPDPIIRRVAHAMVEAGADLIVGSHPHIFQPTEVVYVNNYKADHAADFYDYQPSRMNDRHGNPRKTVIFYSLGNFVSRMYTPSCQIGVISSLTIEKNAETGATDWVLNGSRFVYNLVPTFPGKRHRLMFYDEYKDLYLLKPTKQNLRRKAEIEFMMNHFGTSII